MAVSATSLNAATVAIERKRCECVKCVWVRLQFIGDTSTQADMNAAAHNAEVYQLFGRKRHTKDGKTPRAGAVVQKRITIKKEIWRVASVLEGKSSSSNTYMRECLFTLITNEELYLEQRCIRSVSAWLSSTLVPEPLRNAVCPHSSSLHIMQLKLTLLMRVGQVATLIILREGLCLEQMHLIRLCLALIHGWAAPLKHGHWALPVLPVSCHAEIQSCPMFNLTIWAKKMDICAWTGANNTKAKCGDNQHIGRWGSCARFSVEKMKPPTFPPLLRISLCQC